MLWMLFLWLMTPDAILSGFYHHTVSSTRHRARYTEAKLLLGSVLSTVPTLVLDMFFTLGPGLMYGSQTACLPVLLYVNCHSCCHL